MKQDDMRIMMLAIHFPLDIEKIRGGVHSAVGNLLKGFSKLNVRMRLLSFSDEIKEEQLVKFSDNIDIMHYPEGPFPFHSLNYLLKCSFNVKKQVKEFKPDIIHYEVGDAFLFTKVFGLKNTMHLQTIHGIAMAEGRTSKKIKTKLTSYFNGLMERALFPNNIIHLSQYSLGFFKNKKVDNFTIIPNAVTEGYFKLPIKNNTSNRLIYIGVIDRNKNILFLLKALNEMIKKNKPFDIDILGDFKDKNFKKEVMEYINENKLARYLHFHGWVTQSTVMKIIAEADILIVSSKQESLPMVIAECMAAGKLVLASSAGGIPEMVENGVTGYIIDNTNVDTLVSRLDELHNNNDKVKAFSARAKEVAMEKYHCDSVASNTLEFYRKVKV